MQIDALRDEVSRIDRDIIGLIAKRQLLAGQIARVKVNEGIPIHDHARVHEVLEYVFDTAVEEKIDPVAVQKVFEVLIAMSEERQRECTGDGNLP
ncbi:MAG: chorismate mutase [Methanomicrobiales archaeon]|jgi:chorismate mutase|nr:chorismate mutase [Methanomicrobiales archaeon]